MNEAHDTISVDQLLRPLRRRWWMIAPLVMVGGVVGALLALTSSERYEATATVLIGFPHVQGTDANATLSAGAVARLVRTRAVAGPVSRELADGRAPAELLGAVSTRADDTGAYIEVAALDDEPEGAARLANAFAGQLAAIQNGPAADLEAAIEATERKLASVPTTEPAYDSLRSELADLRTTAILRRVGAEVIDPAIPGAERGGGAVLRGTLSGAGLGLMLALIVVFGLEALDPRVRTLGQLGRLTGAPRLAAMPAPKFHLRRDKMPAVLAAGRQPFEHLRGALLALYGEDRLRRLVMTSPTDIAEGKTSVAAGLAVSLARLGMRVCAVDADLRRPGLASHFGLDDAATGLADALRGTPLAQAVQRFALDRDPTADVNGPDKPVQVDVVAAGSRDADAAELLAGERMRDVLEELGRDHDVVILDCAPILKVSDGLPLLEQAPGTVLVVRHSRTLRRTVARAERVVAEAKGSLLGVVATGVPRAELTEEGYGPWPSSPPPVPNPNA